MGSEAHPTLSKDDGDGTPASCLLQDFCDAWRLANDLTDADYWLSGGVRKYHCPHLYSRADDVSYDLSMCYKHGADGFTAIREDWRNIVQLPFPPELE